jgi:ABC-type phosphate transport system permease subunit
MDKIAFTRKSLSDVRVIMAIMCIPVVELLCQTVMKRIPTLKYLLSSARGAYDHVLSYRALNVTAS